MMRRTPNHATRALLGLVFLTGTLPEFPGCRLDAARTLQTRYGAERWVERAELRRTQARLLPDTQATADWQAAAALYGRAIEALPPLVGRGRAQTPLEGDVERLVNRAVLGYVEVLRELEEHADALRWAGLLFGNSPYWPGTQGRAALEIARCHDAARDWAAALQGYRAWCTGVRDGDWPLHRSELDVATYVSRRLADRGQFDARRAWVSLAQEALQQAGQRGEHARDARYARFLLLLDAENWDAALQALRLTRRMHDPQGHDGGLVLAEANLLAGALKRPDEAMGLLVGVYRDGSGQSVQYRVAALLLAGQIRLRSADLDMAQELYEAAEGLARSSMGRAEAILGLARVHAARGEVELASRRYTQLRTSWPATAAGLLGSLEEYRLLRQHGMDIEAETVLSQAMDHYRSVILQFGTELPALRAAGYLSEVLGRSQSWEQGVAFLDSIAETFSEDPRAGTLLLRAARISAEHLDDPHRAQSLLHRVTQRYPESDLAVAIRPFADSLRSTR
jgi:tetratricopeptide (TPR) repeat protein